MKKKVLLITRPSTGGAERMTLLYGKILEKAGYDIDLLLLQISNNPQDTLLPFIPNRWHYTIKNSRFRKFIYNIWRYIRASKPDIVFSSTNGFSIMLMLLKRFRLIHCKVVIRDCNMPSTYGNKQVRLSKWLYGGADAIISQTKEMKAEMIHYYGLSNNAITVINNPIDKDLIAEKLKEKVNLEAGKPIFVACGRIAPQKDYDNLLSAMRMVVNQFPNAHLYIIGKGRDNDVYNTHILQLVKDYSIKDNVTFLGFQTNPYKYMIKSDAFVLSSDYEGLPNVMIEAMYLGRPVAVTRCIPYISQVVKDGENGYTCPIKNPVALAEAMIHAIAIKDLPMYVDVNKSENKIIDLFEGVSKA